MDMQGFLREVSGGRTYQRDGDGDFAEVLALFIEADRNGWIDVFVQHHDRAGNSGVDLFTVAGLTGSGRRQLEKA